MIEPGAKNFFTRISWLIILLTALTLMFQVWTIAKRDLSQNEGFFAAIAAEINPSSPMAVAHGVAIKNSYFLYPLTSAVIAENTAWTLSGTMRYINFSFMAMTALLLAVAAGTTKDFKAGIIAAAMFCANPFIFNNTLNATPLMMSLFWLFAAQTAWIYFGFSKGRWNMAWLFSMLLLSLGFLTGGIKILILFFLPLFFLHRPLKFSSKINKKGFIAGLIILGAFFLWWASPFILRSREFAWDYIPLHYRGMGNFLLNILISPLYMMFMLLPWTLLIWMPFCVAIRPLDNRPIFSHYFRVIFITDFLFILFNPFSTTEDFIYTIPPLVLLCAMIYDTAVRRYSVEMRRLVILCGYIQAALTAILIIYCFCPHEDLSRYVNFLPLENKDPIFSAILAFFGLSVWIYHYRKKGQLWLIMLFTGVSIGAFMQLTLIPYSTADRSRSQLGLNIRKAIEEDGGKNNVTVYKNDILDLYSESYYMNKKVRKINQLANIDKKEQTIYLLTTNFPQYPERTWKNLFETTYRGQKLYLYRGEIAKRKEFINRRNPDNISPEDKK